MEPKNHQALKSGKSSEPNLQFLLIRWSISPSNFKVSQWTTRTSKACTLICSLSITWDRRHARWTARGICRSRSWFFGGFIGISFIHWVWPPLSNSGKWRFRLGFPNQKMFHNGGEWHPGRGPYLIHGPWLVYLGLLPQSVTVATTILTFLFSLGGSLLINLHLPLGEASHPKTLYPHWRGCWKSHNPPTRVGV